MKTDSTELSSPTGIYSDREIAAALVGGHIVCDPAPARINGSSVDVTLGYYFYRAGSQGKERLFNPFDETDVRRYFGEYKIAKPWHEVRRRITDQSVANIDNFKGINDEFLFIIKIHRF